MGEWLSILIGGGNVLLTIGIAAIGGIWALRNNNDELENRLDERIDQVGAEATNAIFDLNRRVDQDLDEWSRRYGDSLAAIRQKMMDIELAAKQIELWNRDNFVSKETFRATVEDFKSLARDLSNKMDDRFNRLENRLDRRLNDDHG